MRVLTLTCVVLIAACQPDDDVATAAGELNGTVTFASDDCTFDANAQARIREAMTILRGILVDHPDPMLSCLRDGYLSGAFTGSDAAIILDHPEWMMQRMAENLPTTVTCSNRNGAAANVGIPYESLSLLGSAGTYEIGLLVGTLAHEIGHNKGWDHFNGAEYLYSANQQLRYCAELVYAGFTPLVGPPFRPRSAFVQETTLAPVGEPRGNGFDGVCPGTTVAAGLFGRETWDATQQIGLRCKPRGVDNQDVQTAASGSTSGTSFIQRCFPGEVMVGAWGFADTRLQGVGPLCLAESAVLGGSTFHYQDPSHGGYYGASWTRRCPPGMAVKGLRGRTAMRFTGRVEELEIDCQRLSNPQPITRKTDFVLAGGENDRAWDTREMCVARGALVGVGTSYENGVLVRANGACWEIATDAQGANRRWGSAMEILTPGYGGYPSIFTAVSDDRCPSNMAVVGLWINWGTARGRTTVLGTWPTCASVTAWSDPSQPAPLTYLPFRGQATGSWVFEQCPRGQLASGLGMGTDAAVRSLSVVCRAFTGDSQHPPG